MKTYLLKSVFTSLCFLSTITLFGQKKLSKKPALEPPKFLKSKKVNQKYSATTAHFLKEKSYLKTGRITKNGQNYINTIVLLNDNCSIADISDLPILINTGNKNLITALIPVNSFQTVSKNQCIKYMDIGAPFQNSLDEVRNLTNVDLVHQGLGLSSIYDGSGVIVGVIDQGFDFTHPTFRDNHGNSRISKVWIQGDNTGVNPEGYNYGSEYIGETEIVAKQKDMTEQSHGTHVTGIAAGSGIDGGEDDFKGIAYNSEIVLVSYNLNTDELFSNSNVNVIDALNYLVNYANSVNKPLVINMSFGSHFGAHDGTSLVDQEIDDLVGEGIVIVGAAGNEGEKKIHVSSDFVTNETKNYFIENNGNQVTAVDVWGSANTNFNVKFNIYNINTDEWIDVLPAYINTSTTIQGEETLNDTNDDDKWSISYVVYNELNQKPRILFTIDYSEDTVLNDGDIFVLEINAEHTSIDSWCALPGFTSEFENHGYIDVVDGDSNMTIREIAGTANKIITVGAYTSKNNYDDFFGVNHNSNVYTDIGEIAPFSSRGTTADGRMKPDIAAPGNVVVSSVSSFDTNYIASSSTVVTGVTDGSQEWWYATLEGTSMASPVVTGIIALWLQAKPDLTVDEIKSMLNTTAILDSYTGSANNDIWGRGKIDAWTALSLIEQTLSVDQHTEERDLVVYPNPTESIINIITTENYTNFKLFNILGQEFKNYKFQNSPQGYVLDLIGLKSGIYMLQMLNGNKIKMIKLIKK
jgi:subtilisin family serine protease